MEAMPDASEKVKLTFGLISNSEMASFRHENLMPECY